MFLKKQPPTSSDQEPDDPNDRVNAADEPARKRMKFSPSSTRMASLSPDQLVPIFLYVGARIVPTALLVCRKWHNVLDLIPSSMWKSVFQSSFGFEFPSEDVVETRNWRKRCRQRVGMHDFYAPRAIRPALLDSRYVVLGRTQSRMESNRKVPGRPEEEMVCEYWDASGPVVDIVRFCDCSIRLFSRTNPAVTRVVRVVDRSRWGRDFQDLFIGLLTIRIGQEMVFCLDYETGDAFANENLIEETVSAVQLDTAKGRILTPGTFLSFLYWIGSPFLIAKRYTKELSGQELWNQLDGRIADCFQELEDFDLENGQIEEFAVDVAGRCSVSDDESPGEEDAGFLDDSENEGEMAPLDGDDEFFLLEEDSDGEEYEVFVPKKEESLESVETDQIECEDC